jgi:rhodanese-related sulfurtransferase
LRERKGWGRRRQRNPEAQNLRWGHREDRKIAKSLRAGAAVLIGAFIWGAATGSAAAQGSVYQATLGEKNQKTAEISTEDVRSILADGSAILLDSRPRAQYVAGHIAGARNVAPPANAPASDYVAAVENVVQGDKRKALVLYCNGQYCQASRTLGDQLVAAGFTNVRRYQLGLPMWRALNGLVEIELEGILRIYRIDQTAVFLDARPAADFTKLSLPGTYNMPADGLANRGLRNAPLPNNDFNTRVVLFGHDFVQARALAEAIAKTPFQNVSYFPGTFEALVAALQESIASRR